MKIKITKKLVLIVSIVLAVVLAGGVVGTVLYSRHRAQFDLERQEKMSAAVSTANGFASEMDMAVGGVVSTAAKKYQEEQDRLETESKAAAEASKKAAEDTAKKKQEEQKKPQTSGGSFGNPGGGAAYIGLALYASKYIGNTDMTCDELIWNAMKDMGYPYTMVTATRKVDGSDKEVPYVDFVKYCTEVPLDQLQMSDILCSEGHVEVYIGGGRSIHGGWGNGHKNVIIAGTSKNLYKAYRLS